MEEVKYVPPTPDEMFKDCDHVFTQGDIGLISVASTAVDHLTASGVLSDEERGTISSILLKYNCMINEQVNSK